MVENIVGKGENAVYPAFCPLLTMFSKFFPKVVKSRRCFVKPLATFNLSSAKVLNLDETKIFVSKRAENTRKKKNCSLRTISPFPAVFSKELHHRLVKTWACLGKNP